MNTNTEIKDHQIAELVNKLRDTAIEFHGAQQLRSRIQDAVLPIISDLRAEVARLQAALAKQAGVAPVGFDAWVSTRPDIRKYSRDMSVAEDAFAAAIAQRVGCGEPVARVTGYYDGYCVIRPMIPGVILPIGTVFYTTPPAAVTDAARISALYDDNVLNPTADWQSLMYTARDIARGIANAAITAAVTDADKRDKALPACQCFTEQQEQYCVRQRKCQGKAIAYAAIAASEQEGKLMAKKRNDFERGFYCAVALLLKMEGCASTQVRELFDMGGNPSAADKFDVELFVEHGLLPASEQANKREGV